MAQMNGQCGKTGFCYTESMHIAIDVREACRAQKAGKGQWVAGFVTGLLTRGQELTLCTDAVLPAAWQKVIQKASRIHVHNDPSSGLRWHWNTAQFLLNNPSIDVYVSPTSYIVPFLLGSKKKVVPVVHDLIVFRHEPHDRRATLIEWLTLGRCIRHAHAICTVSATTKQDLLARFFTLDPRRVVPVFAAAMGEPFKKEKTDGSILCIATLCPRKNQKRLMEAYAALPNDLKEQHRLILVGSRGWHDAEIVKRATSTPGIEWKSYLSDEECRALMSRAMVFAFPSLYEGFGLPILDAMRAGVPVLTSDVGSMKEVAGDAAVLVDPTNTESIRDGLVTLLTNETIRADMAARGTKRAQEFSWKKTVDRFLNAVHDSSL